MIKQKQHEVYATAINATGKMMMHRVYDLFFVLILMSLLSCDPGQENPQTPEVPEVSKLPQQIPMSNFIEHIIGMSETKFKANFNELAPRVLNVSTDSQGTKYYIVNQSNGKQYLAGTFEEKSVSQLRNETGSLAKKLNGTFNVVVGVGTTESSSFFNKLEVASLQSDRENNAATFLVASNMNALETVNASVNIDTALLKDYIFDKTQGPAAAISAAASLFYRRYFIFNEAKAAPLSNWQQSRRHFINFMANTPLGPLVTSAGYVVFDGTSPAPMPADLENMRVGIQKDAQVVFGTPSANQYTVVADSNQKIHQVYAAAIDFASNSYAASPNAEWGQTVLDSIYEGAVRSAWHLGSPKLFLTDIGGGVFKNPLQSIIQAMAKQEELIKESGLKVIFTKFIRDSSFLAHQQQLIDLVDRSGGTFIVYENNSKNCLSKLCE